MARPRRADADSRHGVRLLAAGVTVVMAAFGVACSRSELLEEALGVRDAAGGGEGVRDASEGTFSAAEGGPRDSGARASLDAQGGMAPDAQGGDGETPRDLDAGHEDAPDAEAQDAAARDATALDSSPAPDATLDGSADGDAACDGATCACTSDAQCTGGAFCWQGACVELTAIAVGDGHACALTSAGTVQCWGAGGAGQLGNGSSTFSLVPVAVVGLSDVTAIAAGGQRTCALTAGGSVFCWGADNYGQLGNGSVAADSLVPVPVIGLDGGVTAISASDIGACALTSGGGVLCWGYNGGDQLGNADAGASSAAPVPAAGLLSGITAIATGTSGTCALTEQGAVVCWGYDGDGVLGTFPPPQESVVPLAVPGLGSGVVAISMSNGGSACALEGNAPLCWGANNYGQLGNGLTGTDDSNPTVVSPFASGVSSVVALAEYTCVVTTEGALWCWGAGGYGQLGNGVFGDNATPTMVQGLSSGVVAIRGGSTSACAVTRAGRAFCWGENSGGELGNGVTTSSSVPVAVLEP